jgi:hypothetical protein
MIFQKLLLRILRSSVISRLPSKIDHNVATEILMRDRIVKNKIASLGAAILALIFSGCGGGGGGGPAPPPGPPATGTITTGTVLLVSGRAVDLAFQSGGFGSITNIVGLTTVATNDPVSLGKGVVTKPGVWNVNSQIPVGPETTLCAVTGSVTVSGDIGSPLTVTEGDFLDYLWANCDDGLGQVINGLIGMTFTEFEGNLLAGRILLRVSLAVQGFQVTDRTGSHTTTGDLALSIDSRTQPLTVVTTMGSSLMVNNGFSTETLTEFSSIVTEDTSMFPANFTTEATGRVSSTQFSGVVSYDTPVPFQATGDGFPYEGEMLVFGTAGASIRITAVDEANVRIEADYNGDGASDATIETTWAALVDG